MSDQSSEFPGWESASDVPEKAPLQIRRGRGALSNEGSRYLPTRSEWLDDERADNGWAVDEIVDAGCALETRLLADRTVRLITRNRSPDIPFDRSINPFKGCEHGCVYCFARPTHAYLDLSPGLDFETRIFYKTGVRERLQAELSHPGYQVQPIALGTNTDPYQPAEKQLRVTREILELLLEWRHPLTIVTKSQLILRDLDLLEEMARMHLVQVHLSVTTLSNDLKVKLEPRTASPAARLRTVRALSEAGVPAGVMVAPVIPFINDAEMEAIIAAGVAAGARRFGYILLRLPLEVAPLFEEWLDTHYPLKKTRVLNAVRQTRGGRLYDAAWGTRMTGRGEIAQLLQNRFRHALRKQGIDAGGFDAALRSDLFSHPGYQASLF